jgi:hypothetical protein
MATAPQAQKKPRRVKKLIIFTLQQFEDVTITRGTISNEVNKMRNDDNIPAFQPPMRARLPAA